MLINTLLVHVACLCLLCGLVNWSPMSKDKPLFTCEIDRQELLKLIQAAGKAMPGKALVALLDSLKLDCSDKGIRVTGYDLSFAIVASSVTETISRAEGSCEVLTKRDRLQEVLGSLVVEKVLLSVAADYTIEVADPSRPQKTFFRFTGQAASEYPSVQAHKEVVYPAMTFDALFLKKLINRTRFSSAYNDVRLYFNGIYFHAAAEKVTVVGTDGFRMSVMEAALPQRVEKSIEAIIPSKAVEEMAKLLPDEGEVELIFSHKEDMGDESHMQSLNVKWAGYDVTFRLIDSPYPDWKRVMPKEKLGSARFTRQELATMIKSLMAFSSASNEFEQGGLVRLKVSDGVLSGISKWENEEAHFEFAVQQTGADVEITFDGRYFLSLFSAVGNSAGEEMVFEYTDALKQGVLKFTEDPGFTYVMMPIRGQ